MRLGQPEPMKRRRTSTGEQGAGEENIISRLSNRIGTEKKKHQVGVHAPWRVRRPKYSSSFFVLFLPCSHFCIRVRDPAEEPDRVGNLQTAMQANTQAGKSGG